MGIGFAQYYGRDLAQFSKKKNEKHDFAVNAARIGDEVPRKMVLDSYARKKCIDTLAENTKNSSGEGVRP